MKMIIFFLMAVMFCITASAQKDSLKQFILVIRYNPNMKQPTSEAIEKNIGHWNDFMGELGKNGQIVEGYRPTSDGQTVSNKGTSKGAYIGNNETMSSILIIKAAEIKAAEAIAKKCPILEFDGSIEIRPLMQMAK
ncbi:MAG TPA: YciI family protein [Chitinophagaceae bacterium]|nr:YciI family protein [Chitinophagaceae bacterium]